jgi:hypothetical protein
MELGMTDEDVIMKFFAVIGCGKVYGPYIRNGKSGFRRKPIWRWKLWDREEVEFIYSLFQPYLGQRRLQRFREVLRAAETARAA